MQALVPDAYAHSQFMHKGHGIHISVQMFKINFEVPHKATTAKKSLLAVTNSKCAQELPKKIKLTKFYFNSIVAHQRRLYGVKITTTRAIENVTLGHL